MPVALEAFKGLGGCSKSMPCMIIYKILFWSRISLTATLST